MVIKKVNRKGDAKSTCNEIHKNCDRNLFILRIYLATTAATVGLFGNENGVACCVACDQPKYRYCSVKYTVWGLAVHHWTHTRLRARFCAVYTSETFYSYFTYPEVDNHFSMTLNWIPLTMASNLYSFDSKKLRFASHPSHNNNRTAPLAAQAKSSKSKLWFQLYRNGIGLSAFYLFAEVAATCQDYKTFRFLQ